MAPLQEAHKASLLYDEDEDVPVQSASDSGEHEVDEPPSKRPKSDLGTQSSSPKTGESTTGPNSKVDSLVTEVTEDEVTGPAISEKIASVLNNIFASGLNEQATKRRKENIHRPSNSKLLTQTRVNPEIWDIAKKQTRSMDSRLQTLQDTLIKGLIPLADLIGKVGESLDSGTAMPTKEALWEELSNSLLLVAAANHSLNICRRDMFKTDLDDNYKALCNNKHPIGSELFGDDFTERLKTVTESNKAAKQLTRSNKSVSQKYKGSSKPFFSPRGAQSAPLPSVQFQCTRLPEKQPSQLQEGILQNRIQDSQTDCETVVTQPEVSAGPITITGGRIKNFIATWQEITSDKTILSVVLGYKLEFYGLQPIQIGKIRPTVLNSEAEAALDEQIQNFFIAEHTC